ILVYAEKNGEFVANPEVVIYENDVFELLSEQRTTIGDILADTTDYRQQLREVDRDDKKKVSYLSNMHTLQALAKPVNRQLDRAFAALMSTVPHEAKEGTHE